MWAVCDLEVWKKSVELAKDVYLMMMNNPKFSKDYWLKDQIQRCAVSIPSNIAEWCSRWTDKEFVRFLIIARWSTSELETQLLISKEIWYIDDLQFRKFCDNINNIQRMLNGLIKKLSNNWV